MPILAFDHVNVRTARLAEMVEWYGEFLGLFPGPRPPFDMGGAWLYLGDQPYVHLVEVAKDPSASGDFKLEHFAFRAEGMEAFLNKLDGANIPYSIDRVPDFPIVQVNFFDPDGNHIHVDFHTDELPDG